MDRSKIAAGVLAAAVVTFAFPACNGPGSQPLSLAPPAPDHETSPSGTDPGEDSAPDPAPTATPTPPAIPTTDLYTGPESVASFVQKFIDDGVDQGKNVLPDMSGPKLEIRIASLSAYGASVIGLCESGGNIRRVTFSANFWNSVNDTQRMLLTHHELGHCVLYRPHKSTLLPSGAYASIMYPIILSNSAYQAHPDYYIQELFAPSTAAPRAQGDGVTVYVDDQSDL